MPLSPTSIEGNESWYALYPEVMIDISKYYSSPDVKEWLEKKEAADPRYYYASLIERTLVTLGTPLVNLVVAPFLPLGGELQAQLRSQQIR